MTMILDGTKGGTFPSWTTAGRPASPTAGQMGYNSTLGNMEAYTSGNWVPAALNNGVVTNAMLANGYPDQSYVSTDLGSTGFTSTSWTNLGGISIPSAGKWLLWSQLRIRWGTTGYFIKGGLFTSSSSGTGEILDSGGSTQVRMLVERVATNGSFGNLLLTPEWFVDMPTGLSYPYTIYLQVQASASDAQSLNNNDANGIPTLSVLKVASTTTSGTTITCQ